MIKMDIIQECIQTLKKLEINMALKNFIYKIKMVKVIV